MSSPTGRANEKLRRQECAKRGICTICMTARARPWARSCESCRPGPRPDEPTWEVPRCRCGLALPCNACLPPIEYYAAQRR